MNILTFDLEDWFHVLDFEKTRDPNGWPGFESRIRANVERILSVLESRRLKATFFCLGWVAERYPEVIQRIDAAGHEIASHSYGHQLIYRQSPVEFEEDLRRSIAALGDLTGKRVRAYRAPGFSMTGETLWAYPLLVKHGIEIDCSIFPGSRGHGGMPDVFLRGPALLQGDFGQMKLFPMTVATIGTWASVGYVGGGYFRLLPWGVIKLLVERSPYNMTYFHPRDFDPRQPRLSGLGPIRHFKTYVGLAGALGKFELLLDSFPFVDLRTAERGVDWERAERLRLQGVRMIAQRTP